MSAFEMPAPLMIVVRFLLSPSRLYIDWRKGRKDDRAYRGDALRSWSLGLFLFELALCIALTWFATNPAPADFTLIGGLALVYAWSRVNEIAYAFYADTSSDEKKKSNLTRTERIQMAMRSYYGLAFNFSLAYFFMPLPEVFNRQLANYWEAFYFSGVTIATLGYGDIFPMRFLSRALSLYEVFAGLLIVAVAIATYAGSSDGEVVDSSGRGEA